MVAPWSAIGSCAAVTALHANGGSQAGKPFPTENDAIWQAPRSEDGKPTEKVAVLAAGLALGASVGWGSADYIGGLKSRELSVLTVLVGSQAIQCLLMVAAAVIIAPHIEGRGFIGYAMLSAIVQTIGMVAYYRALSIGVMGIVAPVSAMAALVPVVVGVASGDRPTTVQAVGVGFAIVGLILASYQPDHRGVHGGVVAVGVGLALIAALGFGSFYVFIDRASDDGNTIAAVMLNKITVLVLLVAALVVHGRSRFAEVDRGRAFDIGLLACLALGATLLFATATTKGLVSLVAVLGALYPVTTAVMARVLLEERIRTVQRLGAVAALVGVAMIAA
jgi:drug/metabolite transporter (DMT)-like permease